MVRKWAGSKRHDGYSPGQQIQTHAQLLGLFPLQICETTPLTFVDANRKARTLAVQLMSESCPCFILPSENVRQLSYRRFLRGKHVGCMLLRKGSRCVTVSLQFSQRQKLRALMPDA